MVCKASYRSKSGLTQHKTIVQKYNTWREGLYTLVLVAVKSCKSKNQVKIMVVNHNYHLLANHNSIVFTTNFTTHIYNITTHLGCNSKYSNFTYGNQL
jgi:hypothetical protein